MPGTSDIENQAHNELKNQVEEAEREKKHEAQYEYGDEFFRTQAKILNQVSEAFGQEPIFRKDEEAWSEVEYDRNMDHANDNKEKNEDD